MDILTIKRSGPAQTAIIMQGEQRVASLYSESQDIGRSIIEFYNKRSSILDTVKTAEAIADDVLATGLIQNEEWFKDLLHKSKGVLASEPAQDIRFAIFGNDMLETIRSAKSLLEQEGYTTNEYESVMDKINETLDSVLGL